jgi:hypothetical protein
LKHKNGAAQRNDLRSGNSGHDGGKDDRFAEHFERLWVVEKTEKTYLKECNEFGLLFG